MVGRIGKSGRKVKIGVDVGASGRPGCPGVPKRARFLLLRADREEALRAVAPVNSPAFSSFAQATEDRLHRFDVVVSPSLSTVAHDRPDQTGVKLRRRLRPCFECGGLAPLSSGETWLAGEPAEAHHFCRFRVYPVTCHSKGNVRKLASGSDPAGVEPPTAQSGTRSPHSKVARSMRRRWETQLGDRDSEFPTHSLRRRSLRQGLRRSLRRSLSRKQLSASLCRELCRINTRRKGCLT